MGAFDHWIGFAPLEIDTVEHYLDGIRATSSPLVPTGMATYMSVCNAELELVKTFIFTDWSRRRFGESDRQI